METNKEKVELNDDELDLVAGGMDAEAEKEFKELSHEFTNLFLEFMTMKGGSQRDEVGNRIKTIIKRMFELKMQDGDFLLKHSSNELNMDIDTFNKFFEDN